MTLLHRKAFLITGRLWVGFDNSNMVSLTVNVYQSIQTAISFHAICDYNMVSENVKLLLKKKQMRRTTELLKKQISKQELCTYAWTSFRMMIEFEIEEMWLCIKHFECLLHYQNNTMYPYEYIYIHIFKERCGEYCICTIASENEFTHWPIEHAHATLLCLLLLW